MAYVIVKYIKTNKNDTLPVILIDSQNEILEFTEKAEADTFAKLLEMNSHTQTKYEVKKI